MGMDAMTSTGARVLYYSTARSPVERMSFSEALDQYDSEVRARIMQRTEGVDQPPIVMVDVAERSQAFDDSLYHEDQIHLGGEIYRHWGTWGRDAIAQADLK